MVAINRIPIPSPQLRLSWGSVCVRHVVFHGTVNLIMLIVNFIILTQERPESLRNTCDVASLCVCNERGGHDLVQPTPPIIFKS